MAGYSIGLGRKNAAEGEITRSGISQKPADDNWKSEEKESDKKLKFPDFTTSSTCKFEGGGKTSNHFLIS